MRVSTRRLLLSALAATALSLSMATSSASAPAASSAATGNYIVTLAEGADLSGALQRHGVAASHRYSKVLNGFAATLSARQLNALRNDSRVTRIEPDGVATVSTTQHNPPSWGLDRIDQQDLPLSDSYTYTATAPGVHAYIIDTGIDVNHNDFDGRAVWEISTVRGPSRDCHGHGTHVAGTVGGTAHGVAKEVQLHAVKVLDCSGSGSWSSVIAGMDWVADNHLKPAVANMSLGGGKNDSVNDALDNMADAGVFVSVASGNSDDDACDYSPASAANATTVNASDSGDTKASFSNFGSCTHLYAPGVDITSTTPRNGTATWSGTSMAAPHVAGVAAMYKATFGDASFSTVRSWLVNNATSGVISGNPSGTPNELLYTNDL